MLWFAHEVDVEFVVRWPRPAADVARALASGLCRDGDLRRTTFGTGRAYRLTGSVTDRRLELRVKPAIFPWFDWPYMVATGKIRDIPSGSELRGSVEIPGARSRTWLAVLAALVIMLALLPMADLGPAAYILVAIPLALGVAAPALRPQNLRAYATDLETTLAALGGNNVSSPAASIRTPDKRAQSKGG